MTETRLERAVLLADITGSTPLYETVGDAEAAQRVGRCVDWMRDVVEGGEGVFIAAKGDDVLATFQSADRALQAIETIMSGMPMGGLHVHAGLHFGALVATRDDIFGDAVNLTARLASAANPGEVLISRDLVERLSPEGAARLHPLTTLRLKGRSVPVEVYAIDVETQMVGTGPGAAGLATRSVRLRVGETERHLQEGTKLSLGRAPENDVVLSEQWVSRRHATIAVDGGRVQLIDHSSYGSYLVIADMAEITARRETVIVSGTARLSLGISTGHPDALILHLEIFSG